MVEDHAERRLAAILAADVVGYSRLTEVDEEGTRARLRSLQAELIAPRIAADGGRIVKTMGDGILAEFPSAVNAVRNALAIQQAMAERNATVTDDRRIEFRVGINVGDVIVEGDDIHGDGVNVAARLEGICQPGEVYVSGTVHDQAAGKLAASFEDLGEQQVKNIARPVRTYRVVLSDARGAASDAPKLPDKPSIAVLPFQNMSGDPEQEYFADGIAEDIITALSRFHWFFVIARNSSFSYKGTSPDVRQVAKELGVQYVLEGSVRKGGNRVCITAQLVDALNGQHIWAERYDRDLDDIFAVQDEITEAISGAIAPSFMSAEALRVKRKAPENLDAWDYTIRGNWHLWHFGKADVLEAQRLFEKACELDPTSAAAFTGLGSSRLMESYYQWAANNKETLAAALSAAQRAIALDVDDAMAHAVLGMAYMYARRIADGVTACHQALALNPNLAFAESVLAACHAFGGEYEDAVIHSERAERLSPRDPFRMLWILSRTHAELGSGRYENGVSWAKKAIEVAPDFPAGWRLLAACHGHLGQREEAAAALAEVLRLYPDLTIQSMRTSAFASPEHLERYIEGLRKAGLPE